MVTEEQRLAAENQIDELLRNNELAKTCAISLLSAEISPNKDLLLVTIEAPRGESSPILNRINFPNQIEGIEIKFV